jgi:hypothetical protein
MPTQAALAHALQTIEALPAQSPTRQRLIEGVSVFNQPVEKIGSFSGVIQSIVVSSKIPFLHELQRELTAMRTTAAATASKT